MLQELPINDCPSTWFGGMDPPVESPMTMDLRLRRMSEISYSPDCDYCNCLIMFSLARQTDAVKNRMALWVLPIRLHIAAPWYRDHVSHQHAWLTPLAERCIVYLIHTGESWRFNVEIKCHTIVYSPLAACPVVIKQSCQDSAADGSCVVRSDSRSKKCTDCCILSHRSFMSLRPENSGTCNQSEWLTTRKWKLFRNSLICNRIIINYQFKLRLIHIKIKILSLHSKMLLRTSVNVA